HRCADLPVDGEAATAVQQAAQVVKRPGDVEVRDIDMPVFVRAQRLHEARALGGGLGRAPVEQAGLLEDAVDAGGTARDHVPVEHHEGQAAVALQREQRVEVADGLFLRVRQPVVAWDPGVVLVGLAVAVLPGVPLGGGEAEPAQQASDGQAGLVRPAVDEIDDLIAAVVGNPQSVQSSPSSFFSWTCSSMSSERTSCLRRSLASRAAICWSLASLSALRRWSWAVKAAWPFSKNSFCQL